MSVARLAAGLLVLMGCGKPSVPARASEPGIAVSVPFCPPGLRLLPNARFRDGTGPEKACAELHLSVSPECLEGLAELGGEASVCVLGHVRHSVDMQLPSPASPAPEAPACTLRISITASGISVDETPTTQAQLEATLSEALTCPTANTRVIIEAQRDVDYGAINEVMDSLRTLGLGKISFRADRP